jgi:CBS domain-containing protein
MKLDEVLRRKGRDVITAEPGDTVLDSVRKLVQHNIGALAVVDGSGKLIGVFSERDVLRLSGREAPADFAKMRLREHMSTDLVTADCQAGVEDALAVMTEQRIRHLPVVAEGKLKGMVSQGDLVKAMLEDAQHETRQLTNFVMGKYPA